LGGWGVSELPDGWSEAVLADIAFIQMGQSPNSSTYNEKGIGLPFFQGKAEFGKLFPTIRKWCNEPKKVAEAGDILLSVRAPVGPTNLAEQRCCIGRGLTAIQAITPFNQRYLLHYFRHIQSWMSEQGTGTTFAAVSGEFIRNINIPVAPLDEQKRIADKLDSLLARVDACRDRLDRIPFILKRFRQSVLSAAIAGELTQDWRVSINRSLNSWQEVSSESIFPYITSGSRGWASYYSQEGALFLRVGNLDRETIKLDLQDPQHVKPPISAEGKRTRIEVGDILISITADIGMVAFIREDIGEAYINQHLCLARQTGEYSGAYLAYYLAAPLGGVVQLKEMQKGVTKTGLTLGDIRSITFIIPELDEQEEIVRRIEQIFIYCDRLEDKYRSTCIQVEQLTPTLLNMAFLGELVPQDPADEPASVLLERILIEKAVQTMKPRVLTTRRSNMTKLSRESVKEIINQLANDRFSFEELREEISGNYDLLKDIFFTLLDETDPIVEQVFDREDESIYFVRGSK
jgi:type I restriction enzyme, S subunit